MSKLLIFLMVFMLSPLISQVVINEYSASNLYDYLDNYGMEEDWIELYNTSDNPIDLSGYALSDKIDNPIKWIIPGGTIISANGYITFWCSGRDESSDDNYHTNFTLKQTRNNPEYTILSDADGIIINDFELIKTKLNHSIGRFPNGTGELRIFPSPTLGEENSVAGYLAYAESPEFSLEPGFYFGSQELTLDANDGDVNIRYTTNGNVPTFASTLYSESILLQNTQVVKAIVIPNDPHILPSFVTFGTFFINESHVLPVISSSANDLITLLNGDQTLKPHGTIEYFDEDGDRKDFGYGEYNKHGQDSWQFPQRSFDYIARDEMGYHDAIHEKLLSLSDRDEFQRIIIRASGDDNYPGIDSSAHMRDIFIQKLANKNKMNVDMRKGERCVVYVNGQFWGVYSIREKVSDADYTEYYYGQDKYNVQYLMNWGGTWAQYGGSQAFTDWNTIHDYAMSHDLSNQSYYEHVADEIDVTSLVDYVLINSFVVCTDWINWNTSWWRGLDPNGTHQKWGYVLWDEDATFNHYINYTNVPDETAFADPCYPEDIYLDPEQHIDLLNKLLDNDEFRQYYITRYMDLLNTVFIEDEMIDLIESIQSSITLDMAKHIDRWGGNMLEWIHNVEKIKNFIRDRIDYFPEGLNSCYDLTGPYEITLDVDPPYGGGININSLVIESDEFPWVGSYHGGIQMNLSALDNYEFDHWAFENFAHTPTPEFITSPNISLYFSENDTITALYNSYASDNIIINEINYNSLDTLFNPEDWIELYNPTEQLIQIGNWVFKDEDDTHVFTIPDDTNLDSGEFIVLCREAILFTNAFPNVSNYIGDFEFGLAGGGELLRLYNETGDLIDNVDYNDNDPWPVEADGDGPTLELIDAMSDNSIAQNWASSNGFGTPGTINSVSLLGDVNEDGILNVLDVVLLVNIILSGDFNSVADMNGDGNNDVLDIVNLVNIVLGLNRTDDATFANIKKVGVLCKVIGDGYIGAIQMTLSHGVDFQLELTNEAIISDYQTDGKSTTLIIVNPESYDIFSTSDDYRIETVLIANSSELIDVNMPSEYSLSHAYPNPFNNSTNIDFNIPNEANVTVQIYNLLGKEVATLIDSRMDAGYHHLVWDANSIASGIYFIHMNSNNFTQTEKIILLK